MFAAHLQGKVLFNRVGFNKCFRGEVRHYKRVGTRCPSEELLKFEVGDAARSHLCSQSAGRRRANQRSCAEHSVGGVARRFLASLDQPADVRLRLDLIERQRFDLFRHISLEREMVPRYV